MFVWSLEKIICAMVRQSLTVSPEIGLIQRKVLHGIDHVAVARNEQFHGMISQLDQLLSFREDFLTFHIQLSSCGHFSSSSGQRDYVFDPCLCPLLVVSHHCHILLNGFRINVILRSQHILLVPQRDVGWIRFVGGTCHCNPCQNIVVPEFCRGILQGRAMFKRIF